MQFIDYITVNVVRRVVILYLLQPAKYLQKNI